MQSNLSKPKYKICEGIKNRKKSQKIKEGLRYWVIPNSKTNIIKLLN